MPTVTQTIESSIAGQRYSTDNTYTGSHVSTIDGTFTLTTAGTDYDIPIYAESDADGDIKFIAFKSSVALDKMQLLDQGDVVVIDLLSTIPDSAIVADKTYQIPGSADLPTVTNTDDVEKLRVSATADSASAAIQLSILFDTDISVPDTIG